MAYVVIEREPQIEVFCAEFAKWRAAYPWLTAKRERVEALVRHYGDNPAVYRRLTVWCMAWFTGEY